MLDIIVGLIGVVLIIYLLATVIRPELFCNGGITKWTCMDGCNSQPLSACSCS